MSTEEDGTLVITYRLPRDDPEKEAAGLPNASGTRTEAGGDGDWEALVTSSSKLALVRMCREENLKSSGTAEELRERLREHKQSLS